MKDAYKEIAYTVGSWALPYIINGDATALEGFEQKQVDDWLDTALTTYTDTDGQRWVYAHDVVDTDSRNEFGVDEITGLRGEVYTMTVLFQKEGESK